MLNKWIKQLEKLKSHDDDQTEHSSGGGYRRGVNIQRYCVHFMHKVHKIYKYTVHRRDVFVIVAEAAMDVVVEGDSYMKKDQSAIAKKNRRIIVQQMDMVHKA
jgi:hypothetical protein